uniref:Uncharacterized protein n=1 Tax=Arundo donax TaxID=35708 RepID=A0A0A9GES7_ARUDO
MRRKGGKRTCRGGGRANPATIVTLSCYSPLFVARHSARWEHPDPVVVFFLSSYHGSSGDPFPSPPGVALDDGFLAVGFLSKDWSTARGDGLLNVGRTEQRFKQQLISPSITC